MQTEVLKITGMTCGGCTTNVQQALQGVYGVGDARVSLSAGEATVRYDERLTSPEHLKSAVKGVGYGVADVTNAAPSQDRSGLFG